MNVSPLLSGTLDFLISPFFGQNFGAQRFDRLLEARRTIMRFSLGFGLLLAIIMSLLAGPLTALFTDSLTIRTVAVEYIWIVSCSWGAYGIVMSVNAGFNGSGRPLPGVLISSLRVIFIFLPLAFTGRWLFGLNGIFAASAIANLAVGLLAYIWLKRHIDTSARQ